MNNKEKLEVPKLNEVYNYFDDGKITEARREKCKIIKIIPFNEANKENLNWYNTEKNQCYWLYDSKTDYFVIAEFIEDLDNEENIIFVRSKGGWFSLGWWAGRLDVDGSLTKILESRNE